ncbi:MAG: FtsX-like permease family protein [Bianqueaceae bacterium]
MKASWLLAVRYLIQHKKETLIATLCIAILTSGILAIQLFYQSSVYTYGVQRDERNGAYTCTIFNADYEQVRKERDTLAQNGSGLSQATAPIVCQGIVEEMTPYLGYMDETMRKLRNIRLLEGRMPEGEDEVAAEIDTLYIIAPDAAVGDRIPLTIQTEAGVENREYVLTGILSEYMTTCSYDIQNFYSIQKAEVKTAFPGVLLSREQPDCLYACICTSDTEGPLKTYGGQYDENIFALYPDSIEETQIRNARIISLALTLFVWIVMLVGILNLVEITFSSRKRYIQLLRCVGMDKRRTVAIFILQGGILSGISYILGCGLGIALLYGILGVSRGFGQVFYPVFGATPFLITAAVSIISVVAGYALKAGRQVRSMPLDERTEKKRRLRRNSRKYPQSLSSLWDKANIVKHRKQNILVVLLHFGCAFVLVFGFYLAEFNGMSLYYFMKEKFDTLEYEILIPQGTVTTLGSTVPVKMGVTGETIQWLREKPAVQIEFCGNIITNNMHIVYEAESDIPESLHGYLPWSPRNEGEPSVLQSMADTGYTDQEDFFPYPIGGIDRQQVEAFIPYLEGNLDIDAFEAGRELIAVGGGYSIGDEVRLSLPVVSTAALNYQEPLKGNVEIHWYTATVTAALKSDRKIDNFPSGLLFSYGVMKEADPRLMYDEVVAYTSPETNPEIAEKVMRQATAKSYQVELNSRNRIYAKYEGTINEVKVPVYLILVLFMALSTIALALINVIKMKNNLQGYTLFRAIGLDGKQLRRLLIHENVSNGGFGILTGGVCAFALAAADCLRWPTIYPGTSALFATMVGLFALLALVMLLINVGICVPVQKWILKKAVVHALQEVDY